MWQPHSSGSFSTLVPWRVLHTICAATFVCQRAPRRPASGPRCGSRHRACCVGQRHAEPTSHSATCRRNESQGTFWIQSSLLGAFLQRWEHRLASPCGPCMHRDRKHAPAGAAASSSPAGRALLAATCAPIVSGANDSSWVWAKPAARPRSPSRRASSVGRDARSRKVRRALVLLRIGIAACIWPRHTSLATHPRPCSALWHGPRTPLHPRRPRVTRDRRHPGTAAPSGTLRAGNQQLQPAEVTPVSRRGRASASFSRAADGSGQPASSEVWPTRAKTEACDTNHRLCACGPFLLVVPPVIYFARPSAAVLSKSEAKCFECVLSCIRSSSARFHSCVADAARDNAAV